MEGRELRVAFLVGHDERSTRDSVEAVCRLPGVRPVAILLDTAPSRLLPRLRRFWNHLKKEGLPYFVYRALWEICRVTDAAVWSTGVSRKETLRVLRTAFPDRCFSLDDVGLKYGAAIQAVGNLNGATAVRALKECRADLAVVLGTRVLKPCTFEVPRLGSVNLHKGKVPEYRGLPPGFWELFDGAQTAGITCHFLDEDLDTGDIVATSSVPIARMETPDSLRRKLDEEGPKVLASAVSMIRDGSASRQRQEDRSTQPRKNPLRRDIDLLRKKLPHWQVRSESSCILRNLYLLFVYYSGLYFVVRQWHRLSRHRAGIYLYHRVNDYSKDSLTVDTETFAAQLLAMSRRYRFISSAELAKNVRNHAPLGPVSVAVHFDDCYQDILTNGAPVLNTLGIPACAFINSGFIDTDRSFAHDVKRSPFTFPMLRTSDVQTWVGLGLEVGVHTANHVDLGTCPPDTARVEIVECKRALQEITGKQIDLFCFPFGKARNISASARQIVCEDGFVAMFHADGGFIGPLTDPFEIPRLGAAFDTSPLYCLLQMEGLALAQLRARLRRNSTV